jgi:hypothetical protein
MSSLITGFEYDIFISYRHKDNKGGHWVTEFVDALRPLNSRQPSKKTSPFISMRTRTMDYSKLTT